MMQKLCLLVCLVLGTALANTDTDAVASDLPNISEDHPDQYNKIIVGPLDAEFYGLESQEDDEGDDDDEPLGDIEEEIEEILDELDQEDDVVEEVIEEAEEDETDDDNEGEDEQVPQNGNENNNRRGRGRAKNRKLWKKYGRKSSRRVARFMNKKNVTNIEDVPPRKFLGGRLSKMQRTHQQGRQTGMNRPMKRLYKKVTRRVNRKTSQQESNSRMANVCKKIDKRSAPRRGLMQKVPGELKKEIRQMFSTRRTQLSECCQMDTEARTLCFAEAYVDKMDQICRLTLRQQQLGTEPGLKFKHWQRKAPCCEIVDDDERGECFHEVGASIKAQKKMHKKKKTPESRARAVCKKVDSPIRGPWFKKLFSQMNAQETTKWKAIFQQRRNDMKQCCEHQEMHEMLDCAEDLKEQRYERVCAGQEDFKPEPRYNAQKHGLLVQTCCELEGAPRYQCFNNKGRNLRPAENQTQPTPKPAVFDDSGVEIPALPIVRPNGQGELVVEVELTEELEGGDEVEEELVEDMMMGDAPAVRARLRGRRRNRNQGNAELRRTKRECCQQGKILGQSFPNDGKAMVERQEQCPINAEAYAADFSSLAEMCERVYSQCCLKMQRRPCSDDGGRRGCRRDRRKHRKVHMNVEVDGDVEDMEDLVVEVEKAIEDIAEDI